VTVALHGSLSDSAGRERRAPSSPPVHLDLPRNQNPTKELVLTIVGILIVIILILLAIYLFRRVF
jgi:hypothetical protein